MEWMVFLSWCRYLCRVLLPAVAGFLGLGLYVWVVGIPVAVVAGGGGLRWLALVFVWGGARWGVGGGLISFFRVFSSSVSGAFILAGGLGAGLSFYGD